MNILEWIEKHENTEKTYFCHTSGNIYESIYKYADGDEYIHKETQNGLWEKKIETFINGKLVSAENMRYKNFGWEII